MLRASNDLAAHLVPVDALIQLLVDQATQRDVVAADQVQAVLNLLAGFRVVGRADDALPSVLKNQVGHLVAGEERANERARVRCNDEDFL